MSLLSSSPEYSAVERRQYLQKVSKDRFGRRQWYSRAYITGASALLLVCVLPLFSIISQALSNGWQFISWKFLTTPAAIPNLMDKNAVGGIVTPLEGSLTVVGCALIISVPIAVLLAMGLFEYRNRFMNWLEISLSTFIGLPSILFGLFIYAIIFNVKLGYAGIAGSAALALMMIPLMTIQSLDALRAVPTTLREAGVALGLGRFSIMFHILLPGARARIFTGVFLALARSAGETAPVLFVIGMANSASLSPFSQQTTLTTFVYQLLQSPFPSQRNECWAIGLVLITIVLVFNILGRIVLARANRIK